LWKIESFSSQTGSMWTNHFINTMLYVFFGFRLSHEATSPTPLFSVQSDIAGDIKSKLLMDKDWLVQVDPRGMFSDQDFLS